MTPRVTDPGFSKAWAAAWSADSPEDLVAFYTDDLVYEDVGSALTFHGPDQLRRFFRWMLVFAPDSTVAFDTAHGDASWFTAPWVWSGTAAGPLKVGDRVFPPADRRFSVPGLAWCRIGDDGRIAEHHDYYDMYAVLTQLGYAEPPAPTAGTVPAPAPGRG